MKNELWMLACVIVWLFGTTIGYYLKEHELEQERLKKEHEKELIDRAKFKVNSLVLDEAIIKEMARQRKEIDSLKQVIK